MYTDYIPYTEQLMDFGLKIGDRALIELDDECYLGDVSLITENRVELTNAEDFRSRKKYAATQRLYKKKIKSIRVICSNYSPSLSSSSKISDDEDDPEKLKHTTNINAYELQHINAVLDSCHYIYQTDEVYHKAIRDLRKRSVVALVVEGCSFGRLSRTTIVTFATEDNIYIFDIVFMGSMYKDLKEIIAAERPRKILYNGRTLADNLKYKQNVQINGVFDAFAVHVHISKDKTAISLNKCVAMYINIPENYFFSEENIDWFLRPFDKTRRLTTGKKAILLFKLYEHLIHEQLLSKLYKCSSDFIKFYSENNDPSNIAMKISKLAPDRDIENVSILNRLEELDLKTLDV